MKKIVLFLSLCCFAVTGLSQVGINTASPDAQLQIKSSNQATPANTDGILIPKIDAFPTANPTAAQQGMMVYLTTLSAGKAPGFYYWDNTGVPQWKGIGGAKGWDIIGNSGTNATINFLGTIDSVDVVFRRNNTVSGKIGGTSTSFGFESLSNLSTGNDNTAVGSQSMFSNTIGMENVAVGKETLFVNTSGSLNTAVGFRALGNADAANNTAIGGNAMVNNFSGGENVAVGVESLFNNFNGGNNTGLGRDALHQNSNGQNNTAVGYSSGNLITSGSNNTTVGANANVPNPTASNQLSIANTIYGTGTNLPLTSKIGINEPAPNAKLQISASSQANPNNTDGVIIPKVDAFPFINPGSLQNGMMVFLTTPANKSGFYYWDNPTATWKGIGANSGWGLTGNAGTSAATNFMGTTDDVDVVFKRNNIKSGLISSSNTAFGFKALLGNTTGINNAANGALALQFNTTGYQNTANGVGALQWNTVGFNNAAFGFVALSSNTTGVYNTANGVAALYANTTGDENTASGDGALRYNETGNNNTASGTSTLFYNKAGSKATAIGSGAMQNANDTTTTFDNENVAVGYEALKGSPTPANNTGNSNTAIGYQSLFSNTTGSYNTANGADALYSNTAGTANTAVGNAALGTNTTGSYNNAYGNNALSLNSTGSYNGASGYAALFHNTAGDYNTGNGYYALYSNTTGSNNVAIGNASLRSNESGILNSATGANALYYNKIGNDNTAYGSNTLTDNRAGSKATAIGNGAMQHTNDTATAFDNLNVAVGYEALSGSIVSANNTGNSNTAIGFQALAGNARGGDNTANGVFALNRNTNANNNIAIGNNSLFSQNFANGGVAFDTDNVVVGVEAMYRNNPTSNSNGRQNTVIGNMAMFTNTTGSYNTAIGYQALQRNSAGLYNTATGHNSLFSSTGSENTANGVNAMTNATSGNYNTVIGTNSLYTNTGSSTNTTLGHSTLFSNVSGSGNVAIGYQAGYSELGSNKLYIENSNSATPLIYGEFDNNLVRINGRLNGIYTQLTTNGDSQSSIFGYRNRDSQNDGTNYSLAGTNRAVSGHNLWGDVYTFGVTGHSDNDFTRTGGVLGSITGGSYWSSLGYKNSAGTAYGVYATAALATGTGRFSQPQRNSSIGGGFYGGMIGSWSKGNIIGQVSSGSLFASYNSGDEYTAGRQIELVDTGNQKTAAYTVTSTESVVYKKGKIMLANGFARVDFDENYSRLLGEIPVVTITPMGQCNGLYIDSIDQKGFVIKELNNGTSSVSVSWIAVGDRIDVQQNKVPKAVLEKDFDDHINEVMFNENNKSENAKAIWFDGNNIQFGQLPSEFIEKSTDKKE